MEELPIRLLLLLLGGFLLQRPQRVAPWLARGGLGAEQEGVRLPLLQGEDSAEC